MSKKKRKAYLVIGRTSTRANADPGSPDFETWVNFEIGDVATAWPAHAPIDEWLASGHWEPAEKEQP